MSHPIDIHVGKRLRLRRSMLGLSQEALGDKIGVTFQQIQKYERGINRIGSSRLYELSLILDIPVSYFFEGMQDDGDLPKKADFNSNVVSGGFAENEKKGFEPENLSSKETLSLVRSYYAIESSVLRKKVLGLIKAVADEVKEQEVEKAS